VSKPRGTSYIRAINRALHEEMEYDPRVLIMGLDVGRQGGLFGATRGLYDRFGADRVMDMPISEAGYTGAAIGLAMEGYRPVVEMQFADFVTVAFDQIVTVAAKMYFLTAGAIAVPLVIRMPYGSNLSGQGYMTGAGPHHSQSPESWFCHVAGLKVVMPSTAPDALGLLRSAIRDNNPVMFFEQKSLYYTMHADLPDGEYLVPLGKAAIRRSGSDVTLIAMGAMVLPAMAVAERVAADGISVEVLDPRTLVPLDREAILQSAAKTGRVVITHEAPQTAGFGAEIAAVIAEGAFEHLKAPVVRVCARDMPVRAGSAALAALPSETRLEAALRGLTGASRSYR
jgi:pyruvate/2-oxoglutarate/acetoin dehydrogenase E1 component